MSDHHVEPFTCPVCGTEQDGLISHDSVFLPDPGDAIICLYCESINVWAVGGGLRLATGDEQLQFATSERLQELLAAMRLTKLLHGPPPSQR